MVLIALTGYKGSGKTTLASHLIGWKRMSFATPLKEAVKDLFLLTPDQVYGSTKEVLDPRWHTTPRHLLQIIGTELFRDTLPQHIPLKENIWITHLRLRLQQTKEPVIIDDLRFSDEARMIKELGGFIVRIQRQPEDCKTAEHKSETEQDQIPVDLTIYNQGQLEHAVTLLRAFATAKVTPPE